MAFTPIIDQRTMYTSGYKSIVREPLQERQVFWVIVVIHALLFIVHFYNLCLTVPRLDGMCPGLYETFRAQVKLTCDIKTA